VFNIKASPHIAVSRRPAAPRTIPHGSSLVTRSWGQAIRNDRTTLHEAFAAFATESSMASHDCSPTDMEIAVFLSRAFAAMVAAAHGKAQLPMMDFTSPLS
jgi:hypothetical protein